MAIHTDLHSLFSVTGKVVIVTGAAGGLGRDIAELFALGGAQVVLADRNAQALEDLASRLHEQHRGLALSIVSYDQADPDSIEALVAETEARLGPLDVMINNAAAFGFSSIETLDSEEWDRIQGINLKGVAFCCKSAIRRMAPRQEGKIVNISSIAARRFVLYDNTTYAATKAGTIALTQNLAREYAEKGLRINCVIPGAIASENHAAEVPTTLRGPILEPGFIPTGAPGTPRDVAAACLYLASKAGNYITGQALAVDGGVSVA